MSNVVRASQRRRTETPTGVMSTHASPTLGSTVGLSLWEVAMASGVSGPVHVIDSEQIWTVLEGELAVAIAGHSEVLESGDTVVIPEGMERQVTARTNVRLVVCGHGNADARVPGEQESRGTPPWIA